MSEEKQKTTNILRALITSSNPVDGILLVTLLNDYEKWVGQPLPRFEYESPVDFLYASGEFEIKNVGKDFLIRAKTLAKSQHMSKLVAGQNRPGIRGRPQPNRVQMFRSVQNVLLECVRSNQHVRARESCMSKPQPAHVGATTVNFSFDQLKGEQQRSADAILITSDNRSSAIRNDGTNSQKSITSMQDSKIPVKSKQVHNDNHLRTSAPEIEVKSSKSKSQPAHVGAPTLVFTFEQLRQNRNSELNSNDPSNKKPSNATEVKQELETEVKAVKSQPVKYSLEEFKTDLVNKVQQVKRDIDNITSATVQKMSKPELDNNQRQSRVPTTQARPFKTSTVKFSVDELQDQLNHELNFAQVTEEVDNNQQRERASTADVNPKNDAVDNEIGQQNFDHKQSTVSVTNASSEQESEFSAQPRLCTIALSTVATQLELLKLTPVIISHIDDDGSIFCQLKQDSVRHVNKLIEQFVGQMSKNPFLPITADIPLTKESLAVVYDKETNKFYRAKVIATSKERMEMFFIDHGPTKTIPSSMVYNVQSSYELLKIPPLAIRTKLSGMSKNVIERSVSRLRSHFSHFRHAYVKRMQSDSHVPEVKLYFEQSFMVCVNDSFELENERNRIIAAGDEITKKCADHKDEPKHPNAESDGTNFQRKLYVDVPIPKIGTFQQLAVNSCFDIVVAKTKNPSSFVVKPIEFLPRWQQQMKDLQTYCKETTMTMALEMIEEGEPYACLKSNGYWYRAFIKFHRTKMYAYFCDIADIDEIDNVKKIKFLPNEFRIVPKLALAAKLFGIKPVNDDWEMDDCVQFNRITKAKEFEAVVANVIYDSKRYNNSLLEIKLYYKSDCINDLFVKSGRAVYC